MARQATTDYQQAFTGMSDMINRASSLDEWKEVYRQLVYWELKLSDSESGMEEMLRMQKRDANFNFCKFVK